MNFQTMEYFSAIVEKRGFTRAAASRWSRSISGK